MFTEAVAQGCCLRKGVRPATLLKKETLAQVFSCEFCEISKSIYSYRTPPVAVSFIKEAFLKTSKSPPPMFPCLFLSNFQIHQNSCPIGHPETAAFC